MAKLTLDARLVKLAQKSISYIELHTSITRKGFGTILHILNILLSIPVFIASAVVAVFIIEALSIKESTMMIMILFLTEGTFGSMFLSQTTTWIALRKNLKKKEGLESLPQEITTNKKVRLGYGFAVATFLIFLIYVVTVQHTNNELTAAVASMIIFFTLCFIIMLMIEYFLCTTSLPLGVKEVASSPKSTAVS